MSESRSCCTRRRSFARRIHALSTSPPHARPCALRRNLHADDDLGRLGVHVGDALFELAYYDEADAARGRRLVALSDAWKSDTSALGERIFVLRRARDADISASATMPSPRERADNGLPRARRRTTPKICSPAPTGGASAGSDVELAEACERADAPRRGGRRRRLHGAGEGLKLRTIATRASRIAISVSAPKSMPSGLPLAHIDPLISRRAAARRRAPVDALLDARCRRRTQRGLY